MQKYRRGCRSVRGAGGPAAPFPHAPAGAAGRRLLASTRKCADSTDIRLATGADLPRIFAIYNREVEGGTSTFDIDTREPGRDDGWLTDRDP